MKGGALSNPYESPTFGTALLLRIDGGVGAMSLSPTGRDAVLAGRKGLYVIDLDDPFTPPRWLHHITSWEVADVQWSPHAFQKPSWCISTSNQKALLWDLNRPSTNAIVNVLHAHTRAITDINFHPTHPEMLATCSVDTMIFNWDMRTPRKPVSKFAHFRAGTIQVKYNWENAYELGLTHDNELWIWDTRKGALPIATIVDAHEGKINGLDFSQGLKNIITCSNDETVKFWNLESRESIEAIKDFNYFDKTTEQIFKPSVVLKTEFPVSRARNIPFGSDMACGIMPLLGGGDAIHIVNYEESHQKYLTTGVTQNIDANPAYSFSGHGGPIKDFLWRTRHENYQGFDSKNGWKDFQLVTWSNKDVDLKLWPHDDALYSSVNYNPSFINFRNDLNSDLADAKQDPVCTAYGYETFCKEPEMTIENLAGLKDGDFLSAMALLKLSEGKQRQNEVLSSNHLSWIAGVRIGPSHDRRGTSSSSLFDEDGPANLGEEVSIVGHKFPFVRFEKISVSTGELVITLKGVVPKEGSLNGAQVDEIEGENDDEVDRENRGQDQYPSHELSHGKNERRETKEGSDPMVPQVEVTGFSNKGSSQLMGSEQATGIQSVPDDEANSLKLQNHGIEDDDKYAEVMGGNTEKLVFIRFTVKFPAAYPFLENKTSPSHSKRRRSRKANTVLFDVEQTHELSFNVKKLIEKNLHEIAEFYTNKYHRFCLEYCLRYLMGETIDMDDDLMIENRRDSSGDSVLVEVGNENWVDDLIEQQPNPSGVGGSGGYSSGEDEMATYDDLIPSHDEFVHNGKTSLTQNLGATMTMKLGTGGETQSSYKFNASRDFDSTPLPKGCGAVWAPNGQLVCFFTAESELGENSKKSKSGRKDRLGEKYVYRKDANNGDDDDDADADDDDEGDEHDGNDDNDKDGENNENDDLSESEHDSLDGDKFSEDEIEEDVAQFLNNESSIRNATTELVNSRIVPDRNFTKHGMSQVRSLERYTSHGDNSTSFKDDKSKGKSSKYKNKIVILNYGFMLPNKIELGREYRISGDTPSKLAHFNASITAKHGLSSLTRTWKLLAEILAGVSDSLDNIFEHTKESRLHPQKYFFDSYVHFWGAHPFGSLGVVSEILQHYVKLGDIQTLAVMSCLLSALTSLDHRFIEGQMLSHTVAKGSTNLNTSTYVQTQNMVSPKIGCGFASSNVSTNTNDHSHTFNGAPSYMRGRKLSFNSIHSVTTNTIRSETSFDGNTVGSRRRPLTSNTMLLNSLANNRSLKRVMEPSNKNRLQHQHQYQYQHQRPYSRIEFCDDFRPNPNGFPEFQNITFQFKEEDFSSYRLLYAETLFNWNLPIHRLELLKFNKLMDKIGGADEYLVHKCSIRKRKKNKQLPTQVFINTVSLVITSSHNAWNTTKRQTIKYCTYCQLPLEKSMALCVHCEHALHSHCAKDWWSDNMDECPSGCGCNCLSYSYYN